MSNNLFRIGQSVNYNKEGISLQLIDHEGEMVTLKQGDSGTIKMLGWHGNHKCALVDFHRFTTIIPFDLLVYIPIPGDQEGAA